MKKKLIIVSVVLFIILTITVILTQTPLLHLNEEDVSGKYQNFYTTIYEITKSEKILSHTLQAYSHFGNNYDELKPLFEDAFEIRDNYNQETLEISAYTQLDYCYILFLIRNDKIEEANNHIVDNINKDNFTEISSVLSTIYYTSKEKTETDWSLSKAKELVESDLYQNLIKDEYRAGNLKKSYIITFWSFYAYALFDSGEYVESIKEIEKMAYNINAFDFICTTLKFISDEEDSLKTDFISDVFEFLEDKKVLTDEEIYQLKEYCS